MRLNKPLMVFIGVMLAWFVFSRIRSHDRAGTASSRGPSDGAAATQSAARVRGSGTAPAGDAPVPRDAAGLVAALAEAAAPRSSPPMLNEGSLPPPSPRMTAVLDALAASPQPDVSSLLLPLISSRDERVAAWASEALARRRDAEAAPVLWTRLREGRASAALSRQLQDAFSRLDRRSAVLFVLGRLPAAEWQERERIAQILASSPDPLAIPALIEFLNDHATALRELGVEGLVRIGPESVPALLRLVSGPKERRNSDALRALARIGTPEAMQAVARAFVDPDAYTQHMAREALSAALHPPKPGNRHWIVRETLAFEHPESHLEDVRESAFQALGRLAEDPSAANRIRIAQILPWLGARAAPVLRRLAERDPDAKVRTAALKSLGPAGDRSALPALVQSLQGSAPGTRESAVSALLHLVTDEDLPALLPAVNHPQAAVRSSALRVLRQMRSPEARRVLVEHLYDPDPSAAENAAYSLSRLVPRDPTELPALRHAGMGPHRTVRIQVARILGKHGSAEAAAALAVMLAHPDLLTAEAAEDAVGQTDDDQVFWPLFELAARRAEDGVCREVSPALVRQAQTGYERLLPLLDAPLSSRRAAAAAVLRDVTAPGVRAELSRRIVRMERDVVLNAARSFGDGTDPAAEAALVTWMNERDPGAPLASTFLNFGAAKLREASVSWYQRHGYTVIPIFSPR